MAVFCRLICEQDVIHTFISTKLFLIATSGELALKWFLNKAHFRSYFNENTQTSSDAIFFHTHVLPRHTKVQLLRYCGKRSFLDVAKS